MKYNDTGSKIGTALLILIFTLIIALPFAWIGMMLWNVIVVGVFGLPTLTYWQFYGLMVLLHILLPDRGVQDKKKD